MINHNIDEYEWLEKEFDQWYLTHKQRDHAIARVAHFGGWTVQIEGEDVMPMKVESLEAAKAIAMINAVSNFESFNNAYHYPRRTPKPTPKDIQERVRGLGAVRRVRRLG